jgi:D-lactate dehydrogenase
MKPNHEVKIAFFDAKPYDIESFKTQNQGFGFDITYFPSHLTVDTVPLCQGFDAICAFVNDDITSQIIDQLVNYEIKLIALRSAGYNNVDLKSAQGRIPIVRVPAYSPHGVAEHAVAMMLTLNRNTHRAFYRTRDNNFSINGLLGFDMHGKTVGIVGTGQIGRLVGNILFGFGMKVLAHDPYPNHAWAEETGAEIVDLQTLYAESDIITLHCPLTPTNIHMINKETINMMKKGVMIINTGRGKLIRSEDLLEGLRSGKIGSAGLDVYEEETDYFFEDHSSSIVKDDVLARLLTFPNCLVTSHQAFFTLEAIRNIADTTLSNLQEFFQDQPLTNEICLNGSKNGTCPEINKKP